MGAGHDLSSKVRHIQGYTDECNGHGSIASISNESPVVNAKTNGIYEPTLIYPEPVAICGIALRLPGGIRDTDTFWDLLVNGKDARTEVPIDRYNAKGFNDKLGKKGAIKSQWGYFLSEDLTSLDTSFFSFTKAELEKTDPQQRQILEVVRECLENAGEVNYRGKNIGCYVGTFGEDWLQMSAKESQHSSGYIMTGHGDLMIANRVSYEYDFQGPR
jgi:acyl transferase domain-containing protein